MFKGLFIVTIVLQLLIALTQSGWVRSVAELSAFLLVVLFTFTVKPLSAKQESLNGQK
ncbi:hypothetical protein [Vibrio diazotrophicus]|uniref:hypothetical protein n=1 Tax=Vibrio diazotrophicus TaxID=685 RepID=UPI00142DF3C5|nr:hypothetical protein [Vibrio diazotrophicus]NIY91874.1 hypothetical protein [Vibrio diazotrophicus]